MMVIPLRAISSRAIRMKAASMFWASLAEVSRAASTPLFSARLQASSKSTCLLAWRSDLLPAVVNRVSKNRSEADICSYDSYHFQLNYSFIATLTTTKSSDHLNFTRQKHGACF